jgi:hypothetical protein
MILRELHIDERELPIAGLDARNERVVRYGYFPRKSVKASCWNARENSNCGNSMW